MKRKNMMKLAAGILSTSLLATNPLNVEANTTVDDILEMAYDDLETNEKIETGTTIIENNDKPKVFTEVIEFLDDLELGDIVTVNGIGTSRSDGSGNTTIEYDNAVMAIVRVNANATNPYALAKINEDGTVSSIIGWFSADSIKARYVVKTITEYADVEKTIIDSENIPSYEPNTWDFLNEYYDYIDGLSIQVRYVWPEVERDYDVSFTVEFLENVQTREFYNDDDIFYYQYDWQNGTITHTESGRDKVEIFKKRTLN